MAIHKGWAIRQRTPGGVFYVRLYVKGHEDERSTGSRDPVLADRVAAKMHAEAVAANVGRPKRVHTGGVTLEDLIAAWLASLQNTHAAGTRKTWELYASAHFLPFFRGVEDLTSERCELYTRARLGQVVRETVKKECSALRSFLAFCLKVGAVAEPVTVASMPKRAAGTPYEKRRRSAAVPLSPEHVEAVLAALPEWSTSRKGPRFPVRARFVVAYETSLRPSTLDRLETPKHYRAGEKILRLTAETDKNRWARDVPLSTRAREALDGTIAELDRRAQKQGRERHTGPIFAWHDYRDVLGEAARAALPPELADRFTGAHLRSARITHLLDRGAGLSSVQYLCGHKQTHTTSRYVRPSFQAAEKALEI